MNYEAEFHKIMENKSLIRDNYKIKCLKWYQRIKIFFLSWFKVIRISGAIFRNELKHNG